MDRIKQSNNKSCLASALAMMVDESEQYVLDWFENDGPPFCDEDAYIFLAHHGIYLSLYCKPKEPISFDDVECLNVSLQLNGRPFYLVVESQGFPGKTHAILWDGYKVLDPNPEARNNPSLSNYKIVGFYPMMQTEERDRMFKWKYGK